MIQESPPMTNYHENLGRKKKDTVKPKYCHTRLKEIIGRQREKIYTDKKKDKSQKLLNKIKEEKTKKKKVISKR